MRYDKMIKRYT